MTIQEAIYLVDRLKPNQYEAIHKIRWLSKLDGMIWKEVMMTHVGLTCEQIRQGFQGYEDAARDTELLVPYPYDEDVYNYYLQSQIDKENMEIAKYNQTAALFNNAYKAFCDYYNRTHRPIPKRSEFKV